MRGLLPILTLAAALAPGCSLVVNSDADQCETSADCDSKGGAFVGAVCTRDRTCLAVCSTNHGCTEAIGGPAICVKENKKCAPLLSQDCKTILQEPNAIDRDDAVVVGILMPQTGENAASMKPRVNSMELARRQISNSASGLPGATVGAPRRPLVLLSCTDADDPVRAARHLAEVVRVPAIIGPAFSGVTNTVANQVTIPRGVLIISPSATSPSLTNLTDNGLVWRTAPSDVLQATAMIQLVEKEVEPAVRKALALTMTDKIKLAVVHKGDPYGEGLGGALFTGLKYNGVTPAANKDSGLYLQINYGDPQKVADISANYKKAVDEIVAFKPHVLITVGTTEAVTEIFANVEAKWTETKYKPRHIVADGLQVPELLTKVGTNDELRLRVFGTIGAATGPTYERFVNNYNLEKDFAGTTPDSYSAGAYDATLLVSFAIAGAGNKLLKGSVINDGLKKTVNKSSAAIAIEADPSNINKAFELMPGGGIDYIGASGPLDFDTSTGEAPADIQIWCIRNNMGKTSFAPSSLYFSAASGSLQGTLSCP
jgi:ABC-type branched-subunit amino acid transport system substrate-binding protein